VWRLARDEFGPHTAYSAFDEARPHPLVDAVGLRSSDHKWPQRTRRRRQGWRNHSLQTP
jgi:hypothetical protein